MLSAAIDVGSNTIRLLIGKIQGNSLKRIHSARAITRLAHGIGNSGNLNEENMERSISVMKDFSRSAREYRAGRIAAVGTSAMREAGNGRHFADEVLRETGILVEIISGKREAELTVKGTLLGFEEKSSSMIIDIGGGSTEWIISGGPDLPCGSVPMGVVKCCERFISGDIPSYSDIAALHREIDSHILPVRSRVSDRLSTVSRLIGTGGTITTIAAVELGMKVYDPERVHRRTISLSALQMLRDRLISLPLERRKEIDGLEPERADLIIPGILLTIRFMEIFGFGDITASDYGLIEGLLKEIDDEEGF